MWSLMHDGTMHSGMYWGMGIICSLVVIVLVLSVAALAKYVFMR